MSATDLLLGRTNIEVAAPPPLGVTPNFIDPPNHAAATIPTGWTLLALALTLTLCRMVAKIGTRSLKVKVEDYLIILASAFAIARLVCNTIDINSYWIGRHIWEIPSSHFPQAWFLKVIGDMVYLWALLFTKLSLLFYYLTIFKVMKGFRYLVYGVMVFTVLYLLIFFFTYTFACGIDTWKGTDLVHCLDGVKQEIAIGACNVVSDVIIVVLPLPILRKLQISSRQKIGIFAVFAIGVFTVVSTIMREYFVITKLKRQDQSWNVADEILWMDIEMTVSIICANLLTLPLFVRYVSKLFRPKQSSIPYGSSARTDLSNRRSLWNHSHIAKEPHSFPLDDAHAFKNGKNYTTLGSGAAGFDSQEALRPTEGEMAVRKEIRIDIELEGSDGPSKDLHANANIQRMI